MSVTTTQSKPVDLVSWPTVMRLLLAGMAVALTETRVPTITGEVVPLVDAARLFLGFVVVSLALDVANRSWHLPWRRPSFAIALAFLCCLVAGWLGGVSWPNSGDEYSYICLADTFRAGRLWDP
ncbi:MAG: hypothetical protein ABSC95_30635, partial [Acetobacteraceae bacterium]